MQERFSELSPQTRTFIIVLAALYIGVAIWALPHSRPEVAAGRLPGHRGLFQDLHAHGLPGGPVRAADAPAAVPVPPVDVRRDEGL